MFYGNQSPMTAPHSALRSMCGNISYMLYLHPGRRNPRVWGYGADVRGYTRLSSDLRVLTVLTVTVRLQVRVLDCEGSGSVSDVIAALDWIAENAQRPAVATLSLGIK
eukprot:7593348-Pyramimonas_sp.AAC.1